MKTDARVELQPLQPSDREQFIHDNQEAFNYGALEEFGRRDDYFEGDGEIISRKTIESSIDRGEAYRIMRDGQPVGGVVIQINGKHGDLDLLFVFPRSHSKGIGYAAWRAVERLHPEVTLPRLIFATRQMSVTVIAENSFSFKSSSSASLTTIRVYSGAGPFSSPPYATPSQSDAAMIPQETQHVMYKYGKAVHKRTVL